jgi:hypothetical protein
MNKSILIKIKKNIIIINVIIIFIITLHYYFNKNKFNTLNVYMDYRFNKKILINNHEFLEKLTTSFFFNDIYFNKESYEVNDPYPLIPIKLYINLIEEKLEFKFSITDKKIFNIQFEYANEDLQKKNIQIIDSFVYKILNKYHERVSMILIKKIENLEYEIGEINSLNFNNDEATLDIKIMGLKNEIYHLSNSLNSLKNGEKIIVFDSYTKKFRKTYFKTDEYVLSILILLFLINILIRNIDRVFK